MAYIGEASEDDTIKLLKDLLDYYEAHYEYEIENDDEYAKVYQRCKEIMERILYNKSPLAPNCGIAQSLQNSGLAPRRHV